MRRVLCLSLLVLVSISIYAQRTAGRATASRSVRSSGFIGFVPTPLPTNPNVRTERPFATPPFSNRFNDGFFPFGSINFVPTPFGPFGFNHGFARNTPFLGAFGSGGWGGYYYPYVDYSSWYFDQNQPQYQAQAEQNDRLREDIMTDQRRQMELDQKLADQRAADAASHSAPPRLAASPTPTDRDLPPTVLVYRDHHQVELRNYAVTSSTIYDFGPHWTRKILISDLDLPATVQANQERGIDFRLPKTAAER